MFQQRCITIKSIRDAHKSKRRLEAFAFAFIITSNYSSGQLNDWNIRKIKALCKCNAQKAKQLVSDIFEFKYATPRYRYINRKQIVDIVVRKQKRWGNGIRFNNYNVNDQHILKIKTKKDEQEYTTLKDKKAKQTFSKLVEELSSAYLLYTMKVFGKPDALSLRAKSPQKRKLGNELKFQIAELARSEYVKECVRIEQKYSSGGKSLSVVDIFNKAYEMPVSKCDFVKHLYNTTNCFGKVGLSTESMNKRLHNLYSSRKILRMVKKLSNRNLMKKKRNFIKFGSLKSSGTVYNKAIRVRDKKLDVISVDNEFGGRIRPNKYSKTGNLYRQMPNYFIIEDKTAFWYSNYRIKTKKNSYVLNRT